MNFEHPWTISLNTLRERIRQRRLKLDTKASRDALFVSKVERERRRENLLFSQITNLETIELELSLNKFIDEMQMLRFRYMFTEQLMRRFLNVLDPPLIFEDSDDLTGHVSSCVDCQQARKNAEIIYENLNSEMTGISAEEVKNEFDSIVINLTFSLGNAIGEELEKLGLGQQIVCEVKNC